MSIRVMTRVWDDARIQDQTEVLVMLALADYANDAGECWPSILAIAKRSRIEERSVYRVIDRLIERGWLTKVAGGGRGHSNQYKVLPNPDPKTLINGQCLLNPDPKSVETLTLSQLNPDPKSDEPSYNRQLEPSLFVASAPKKVSGASRRPESYEQLLEYVLSKRLLESDARWLWAKWNGNGFTNGGRKMERWKGVVAQYQIAGIFPSQKPAFR